MVWSPLQPEARTAPSQDRHEIQQLKTGTGTGSKTTWGPCQGSVGSKAGNRTGKGHHGDNIVRSAGTPFASSALSNRHDPRSTSLLQQSSRYVHMDGARSTMQSGALAEFALCTARQRSIRRAGRHPDGTSDSGTAAASPPATNTQSPESATATATATSIHPSWTARGSVGTGGHRVASIRPRIPCKCPLHALEARERSATASPEF